jgi:hypothetical protein
MVGTRLSTLDFVWLALDARLCVAGARLSALDLRAA